MNYVLLTTIGLFAAFTKKIMQLFCFTLWDRPKKVSENMQLRIAHWRSIAHAACLYLCLSERQVRRNRAKILGRAGWKATRYYYSLRLFHLSMYYGGSRIVNFWIDDCAMRLKEHLDPNTFRKTILLPLHVYSDEFAIIVATRAVTGRLDVIADVGNDAWDKRWAFLRGKADINWIANLNLCNPFERDGTKKTRNVMKDFHAGNSTVAIFGDALPAYTNRYGKSQKLEQVNIFGRAAHIHKGPLVFSQRCKADLLPYYVHMKNGRLDIVILDRISSSDPTDVAHCLEKMLTQESDQWMLWHFPFFFYFNG